MPASAALYNTPPTYAWYIAGLVFRWVKAQGGIAAMAERNAGKAARLYACIDGSNFYRSPVPPENRSIMNVPFTLPDPSLDGEFLRLAGERGPAQPQGPPQCRRHAREPLQCGTGGGSRCAGRIHDRVPE